MIDEDRQDDGRDKQELNAEGVMVVVVGGLEAHVDQVQGRVSSGKENHLKQKGITCKK